MVKVASLFSQLLKQFPRAEFAALVKKHRAERRAKGFASWNQFVALLFCQLGRADSMREICHGLSRCLGKLTHPGIGRGPSKSTLAYANEHRPAALYEELFWSVMNRFRSRGLLGPSKKPFRFKNKLLSFDSTTITLCLSLFPWARFRRAKGGVKAHLLLDHDDYMPAFVQITEAKRHDLAAARRLQLPAGSIVALDRGYNDYRLFTRWTDAGIWFVTRLKENAVYEVVEKIRLPENRPILADEIIWLGGSQAEGKCPHLMRRIVAWDAENERQIVLITNHLDFGPLRYLVWVTSASSDSPKSSFAPMR